MATEDEEDADRAPLPDVRGDVEFDDVTFEYNAGVPVLKHVSFRAPAGSTTALVGSSGSGKSTLISLVMAFNRPLSGRRAGRRPRPRRRSSCATTARTSASCCRTTSSSTARSRENIAYARPHATRDEISAVSRIAHCDEFIQALREGLRHDRRRARRAAVGRPAAARRDRARDPGRTRRS